MTFFYIFSFVLKKKKLCIFYNKFLIIKENNKVKKKIFVKKKTIYYPLFPKIYNIVDNNKNNIFNVYYIR